MTLPRLAPTFRQGKMADIFFTTVENGITTAALVALSRCEPKVNNAVFLSHVLLSCI